jgi:hypothetical protein
MKYNYRIEFGTFGLEEAEKMLYTLFTDNYFPMKYIQFLRKKIQQMDYRYSRTVPPLTFQPLYSIEISKMHCLALTGYLVQKKGMRTQVYIFSKQVTLHSDFALRARVLIFCGKEKRSRFCAASLYLSFEHVGMLTACSSAAPECACSKFIHSASRRPSKGARAARGCVVVHSQSHVWIRREPGVWCVVCSPKFRDEAEKVQRFLAVHQERVAAGVHRSRLRQTQQILQKPGILSCIFFLSPDFKSNRISLWGCVYGGM